MTPALTLHIGRPKTGSTALQHFLMKNRQQLLRAGILYPLTGCHQLSSHLFAYGYSDRLRENANLPPVDRTELWQSLGEEVSRESAGHVVLSSENFWFIDPRRLAEDIGGTYNVRVVAYLRRQDNVIASSFSEEVKRELISLESDVSEYALHGPRLELLDYLSILEQWAGCFGIDNLDVRVYESMPPGGIAEDFCATLGLDFEAFEVEQATVNPALPYDVLSLISNMGGLKSGDGPRRRFVTALSEAVVMLDPDPRYDTAGLFPLELRQRIMEVFARSNAVIADRYLPSQGGTLFPSLQQESYQAPREELDPDRVTRLLLGLQANQERTNIRLLRRLAKLEREMSRQSELIASLSEGRERN